MEREYIIVTLCDEDRDHFLETLRNPPKLNQKLKEVFDHYNEESCNH